MTQLLSRQYWMAARRIVGAALALSLACPSPLCADTLKVEQSAESLPLAERLTDTLATGQGRRAGMEEAPASPSGSQRLVRLGRRVAAGWRRFSGPAVMGAAAAVAARSATDAPSAFVAPMALISFALFAVAGVWTYRQWRSPSAPAWRQMSRWRQGGALVWGVASLGFLSRTAPFMVGRESPVTYARTKMSQLNRALRAGQTARVDSVALRPLNLEGTVSVIEAQTSTPVVPRWIPRVGGARMEDTYVVGQADPDRYVVRVIAAQPLDAVEHLVQRIPGAVLAINGGLYHPGGEPTGYLWYDGHERHAWVDPNNNIGLNGLWGIRRDGTVVIASARDPRWQPGGEQFAQRDQFQFLEQVGPVGILDGRMVAPPGFPSNGGRSYTMLAVDDTGESHVIISNSAVMHIQGAVGPSYAEAVQAAADIFFQQTQKHLRFVIVLDSGGSTEMAYLDPDGRWIKRGPRNNRAREAIVYVDRTDAEPGPFFQGLVQKGELVKARRLLVAHLAPSPGALPDDAVREALAWLGQVQETDARLIRRLLGPQEWRTFLEGHGVRLGQSADSTARVINAMAEAVAVHHVRAPRLIKELGTFLIEDAVSREVRGTPLAVISQISGATWSWLDVVSWLERYPVQTAGLFAHDPAMLVALLRGNDAPAAAISLYSRRAPALAAALVSAFRDTPAFSRIADKLVQLSRGDPDQQARALAVLCEAATVRGEEATIALFQDLLRPFVGGSNGSAGLSPLADQLVKLWSREPPLAPLVEQALDHLRQPTPPPTAPPSRAGLEENPEPDEEALLDYVLEDHTRTIRSGTTVNTELLGKALARNGTGGALSAASLLPAIQQYPGDIYLVDDALIGFRGAWKSPDTDYLYLSQRAMSELPVERIHHALANNDLAPFYAWAAQHAPHPIEPAPALALHPLFSEAAPHSVSAEVIQLRAMISEALDALGRRITDGRNERDAQRRVKSEEMGHLKAIDEQPITKTERAVLREETKGRVTEAVRRQEAEFVRVTLAAGTIRTEIGVANEESALQALQRQVMDLDAAVKTARQAITRVVINVQGVRDDRAIALARAGQRLLNGPPTPGLSDAPLLPDATFPLPQTLTPETIKAIHTAWMAAFSPTSTDALADIRLGRFHRPPSGDIEWRAGGGDLSDPTGMRFDAGIVRADIEEGGDEALVIATHTSYPPLAVVGEAWRMGTASPHYLVTYDGWDFHAMVLPAAEMPQRAVWDQLLAEAEAHAARAEELMRAKRQGLQLVGTSTAKTFQQRSIKPAFDDQLWALSRAAQAILTEVLPGNVQPQAIALWQKAWTPTATSLADQFGKGLSRDANKQFMRLEQYVGMARMITDLLIVELVTYADLLGGEGDGAFLTPSAFGPIPAAPRPVMPSSQQAEDLIRAKRQELFRWATQDERGRDRLHLEIAAFTTLKVSEFDDESLGRLKELIDSYLRNSDDQAKRLQAPPGSFLTYLHEEDRRRQQAALQEEQHEARLRRDRRAALLATIQQATEPSLKIIETAVAAPSHEFHADPDLLRAIQHRIAEVRPTIHSALGPTEDAEAVAQAGALVERLREDETTHSHDDGMRQAAAERVIAEQQAAEAREALRQAARTDLSSLIETIRRGLRVLGEHHPADLLTPGQVQTIEADARSRLSRSSRNRRVRQTLLEDRIWEEALLREEHELIQQQAAEVEATLSRLDPELLETTAEAVAAHLTPELWAQVIQGVTEVVETKLQSRGIGVNDTLKGLVDAIPQREPSAIVGAVVEHLWASSAGLEERNDHELQARALIRQQRGLRLRALREQLGLNQAEFGVAVRSDNPVFLTQISRYENGSVGVPDWLMEQAQHLVRVAKGDEGLALAIARADEMWAARHSGGDAEPSPGATLEEPPAARLPAPQPGAAAPLPVPWHVQFAQEVPPDVQPRWLAIAAKLRAGRAPQVYQALVHCVACREQLDRWPNGAELNRWLGVKGSRGSGLYHELHRWFAPLADEAPDWVFASPAGRVRHEPVVLDNVDRVREELEARLAAVGDQLPHAPESRDGAASLVARLREHPGGETTGPQLAAWVPMTFGALKYFGYRALVEAENAQRVENGRLPITLMAFDPLEVTDRLLHAIHDDPGAHGMITLTFQEAEAKLGSPNANVLGANPDLVARVPTALTEAFDGLEPDSGADAAAHARWTTAQELKARGITAVHVGKGTPRRRPVIRDSSSPRPAQPLPEVPTEQVPSSEEAPQYIQSLAELSVGKWVWDRKGRRRVVRKISGEGDRLEVKVAPRLDSPASEEPDWEIYREDAYAVMIKKAPENRLRHATDGPRVVLPTIPRRPRQVTAPRQKLPGSGALPTGTVHHPGDRSSDEASPIAGPELPPVVPVPSAPSILRGDLQVTIGLPPVVSLQEASPGPASPPSPSSIADERTSKIHDVLTGMVQALRAHLRDLALRDPRRLLTPEQLQSYQRTAEATVLKIQARRREDTQDRGRQGVRKSERKHIVRGQRERTRHGTNDRETDSALDQTAVDETLRDLIAIPALDEADRLGVVRDHTVSKVVAAATASSLTPEEWKTLAGTVAEAVQAELQRQPVSLDRALQSVHDGLALEEPDLIVEFVQIELSKKAQPSVGGKPAGRPAGLEEGDHDPEDLAAAWDLVHVRFAGDRTAPIFILFEGFSDHIPLVAKSGMPFGVVVEGVDGVERVRQLILLTTMGPQVEDPQYRIWMGTIGHGLERAHHEFPRYDVRIVTAQNDPKGVLEEAGLVWSGLEEATLQKTRQYFTKARREAAAYGGML